MSVENTDKTIEQFDEWRPEDVLDFVECVTCGRDEFREEVIDGECRGCVGDGLSCLACGSTVRVVESESEGFEWGLACVRCGRLPSVDVRGDLQKAVEAAEEAAGDGGEF